MEPEEFQENTGRGYDNNAGLDGNLVSENNAQFEGEQGFDQFQQDPNQMAQNEKPEQIGSDHSFHVDRIIDDFSRNEQFAEKEKNITQKLDKILQEKAGYSLSTFTGYIFTINKILFLTTFTEFLFQRFDVVTLFLCIAVIFLELEIFSHKHLYKWLLVLISSFLLDAFVLLDISPVSKYLFKRLNYFIHRLVVLI